MRKLRVLSYNNGTLDWSFLSQHCVIVTEVESDFDYALCWKNAPEGIDPGCIVLFQSEPPLSNLITKTYEYRSSYRAFFCFNPSGDNEYEITSDPSCYPYKPAGKLGQSHIYNAVFPRTVFYAGRRSAYMGTPNRFDSINIYPLREKLGQEIINSQRGCVVGQGWGKETKSVGGGDFRHQKQIDIQACNSGFVLAIENSILRNYVSEKIHDGFLSDRVTCYLGAPNIHELIPQGSFVDMMPFVNPEANDIDLDGFFSYIDALSFADVMSIQEHAREFRKEADNRFRNARLETTKLVLEILSNNQG